ncbi:hypothetical protein ACHAXN_000470, partial [Cyclotella atomus]
MSILARLFVFERSDGVWEQTKMLHADSDVYDDWNDDYDDWHIPRIALDGDTAVVGQTFDGNDMWDEKTGSWVSSHGRVFVYTRSNDGTWIDVPQVLDAGSDKASGDYFGDAVAISGNRMIVGASEKGSIKLNQDDS